MKLKRKYLVFIVIGIVLAGIAYLKISSGNNKKLVSTKVKQGNLTEKTTLSGQINAEEIADLRFQTSGRLAWVGVKEGDYVKKYQSIASLDQQDVKKTLQIDLNNYQKERLSFDQSKKENKPLASDSIVRDKIQTLLDSNQLDLNNAVLDVELQNLAVQFSNLWTPIEGIVTRVDVPFAGVNISPATAEFEVVNPTSVYFQATPDQSEVIQFSQGESGELILDAYPDQTLGGTISQIAFIPQSNNSDTVYPIKFKFTADNPDYKYKVGMTGDLTFVTKREYNVLYLPARYIKSTNGKKSVTIMKNNKLTKVSIQTGLETDGGIEITSGLNVNDTVYDQTQ